MKALWDRLFGRKKVVEKKAAPQVQPLPITKSVSRYGMPAAKQAIRDAEFRFGLQLSFGERRELLKILTS